MDGKDALVCLLCFRIRVTAAEGQSLWWSETRIPYPNYPLGPASHNLFGLRFRIEQRAYAVLGAPDALRVLMGVGNGNRVG